jgi:dolichol-phosphate mannosyltransferase
VRILVVLPTYDEAENIETVLRRVTAALDGVNVLVVDDSSPDGTADIAERVGKELGGVEVMRRTAKSGLGSAYRAGFAWGLARGYEAFVEMDSDLSHDPDALPSLVEPLRRGTELVIGSRYVPGGSIPNWAAHRRALSRAGNVYAAALLRLPVNDLTSGYRAYAASVLQRIDLDQVRADSYGFQIEMAHKASIAGAAIEEVPIRFVDRVEGRSKMSTYTVVEALALVTWWGLRRLVVPATTAPVEAGRLGAAEEGDGLSQVG